MKTVETYKNTRKYRLKQIFVLLLLMKYNVGKLTTYLVNFKNILIKKIRKPLIDKNKNQYSVFQC